MKDFDRFLRYPIPCRCGAHIYRPYDGWHHAAWDNTGKCTERLPCLYWQSWDELAVKEQMLKEATEELEQLMERVQYLRGRLGQKSGGS